MRRCFDASFSQWLAVLVSLLLFSGTLDSRSAALVAAEDGRNWGIFRSVESAQQDSRNGENVEACEGLRLQLEEAHGRIEVLKGQLAAARAVAAEAERRVGELEVTEARAVSSEAALSSSREANRAVFRDFQAALAVCFQGARECSKGEGGSARQGSELLGQTSEPLSAKGSGRADGNTQQFQFPSIPPGSVRRTEPEDQGGSKSGSESGWMIEAEEDEDENGIAITGIGESEHKGDVLGGKATLARVLAAGGHELRVSADRLFWSPDLSDSSKAELRSVLLHEVESISSSVTGEICALGHDGEVIFNAGVLSEYPAQELSDFLEESKRLIQRSYQKSSRPAEEAPQIREEKNENTRGKEQVADTEEFAKGAIPGEITSLLQQAEWGEAREMLERNFRPGKINSWQSLMTLSFVLDKLSISSSDRARQVRDEICTGLSKLLVDHSPSASDLKELCAWIQGNKMVARAEEVRQLQDHRVLPFAKLLPPDVVTAKVLGRYFSQNNHDEMSPIATFLNFHLASLIEALTGLTLIPTGSSVVNLASEGSSRSKRTMLPATHVAPEKGMNSDQPMISLAILLDINPSEATWPQNFEIMPRAKFTNGELIAVSLRTSDAVLYWGNEVVTWRDKVVSPNKPVSLTQLELFWKPIVGV